MLTELFKITGNTLLLFIQILTKVINTINNLNLWYAKLIK